MAAILGHAANQDNSRPISAQQLFANYRQVGLRCFEQLGGEYAAAIHDAIGGTLWITNSLSMTRPLFHAKLNGISVVTSEISTVWKTLNFQPRVRPEKLAEIVANSGPTRDFASTSFDGIQRILPPQIYQLAAERPCAIALANYWTPPEIDRSITAPAATEHLENLLTGALQRAINETSAATSVSGGLDSSLIWALQKEMPSTSQSPPFQAYSVKFPKKSCDESELVHHLMRHCGTQAIFIDGNKAKQSDFQADQLKAIDHIVSMPTAYQSDLLCRTMREDGYTTHLTGIGAERSFHISRLMCADRLRAGHPISAWRICNHWKAYGSTARPPGWQRFISECVAPPGSLLRRKLRPPEPPTILDERFHDHWLDEFHDHFALYRTLGYHRGNQIYGNHQYAIGSGLESLQQHASHYKLEIRSPYLDQAIIDFSHRVPTGILNLGNWQKGLLRNVSARWVPREIAWQSKKIDYSEIISDDLSLLKGLKNLEDWLLIDLKVVSARFLQKELNSLAQKSRVSLQLGRLATIERFAKRYF